MIGVAAVGVGLVGLAVPMMECCWLAEDRVSPPHCG